MPNIVLSRIDERLIHGQVGVQWVGILLVCKTPADFLTLVKGGVPVNRINVGNMHYANGKQQIAKTVSVDAGDIAAFNDLKAAGVECFVQGVPTEPAVDLFKLL